jgi:hypothetical protein
MPRSVKLDAALEKASEATRAYRAGKEYLLEQSAKGLEAQTNPLLVVLFLALTVLAWLAAVFLPSFYENMYEAFGLYPIIVVFVFSYLSFFLGSKVIVKPSAEELSDDTSAFALFSACRRRESRSLISVGLAMLHTFLFAFYVVDPTWLGLPQ